MYTTKIPKVSVCAERGRQIDRRKESERGKQSG